MPREESDAPPGGADTSIPNPKPGAVRDDAPPWNPPQKALEKQTKTRRNSSSAKSGSSASDSTCAGGRGLFNAASTPVQATAAE